MNLDDTQGFDILIISSAIQSNEDYWKQKLEDLRGNGIKKEALVLWVHEDWTRGAGNGLGPIYIYQKAYNVAKNEHSVDILEKLMNGASVAIYYTNDIDKKLAPITLAEANFKSNIKLPGFVSDHPPLHQLTLLNAIIKQSSLLASHLKGRVNIFMGEKIFSPVTLQNNPLTHPIETLGLSIPFPTEKEWQDKQLNDQQIIVKDASGKALVLDKIDYATFQYLINEGKIDPAKEVMISAGMTSLAASFWGMLMLECAHELHLKEGKMDANHHFWMPLTLDQSTYVKLMQRKGYIPPISNGHYLRRQRFINSFAPPEEIASLVGIIDIGQSSYLWDLGTVQSYYKNNLKLASNTEEGQAFKDFYCLPKKEEINPSVVIDEQSILVNCQIKSGTVKNCVFFNVEAEHLDVSDCVVINSKIKTLKAEQCLLYNVHSEEDLSLPKETVRVDFDLLENNEYLPLYTQLSRDGEADWNQTIPPNHSSYSEIAKMHENLEAIKSKPSPSVPDTAHSGTLLRSRKISVINKPKS